MKGIFFTIVMGLLPPVLLSQTNSSLPPCYVSKYEDEESAFTRIQINATFKGGPNAFVAFLAQNINHRALIAELSPNQRIYKDTATVKFIISKKSIVSNLNVTKTKTQIFQKEIEEAMKKSCCCWEPGNYSGRLVNGWYQYDIFYSLEIESGKLDIRISYKAYDHIIN